MQFRQRLLLSGFIVSFVLVALLAVFSFVQTDKLWHRVNRAEHAYQVVNSIDQINYELLATDKSAFRYLALRDSSHFKAFSEAALHFSTELQSLNILTAQNQEHQEHVRQLQADAAHYFGSCRRMFAQPGTSFDQLSTTQDFQEMQAQLEAVRDLLSKMSETEARILRVRTEERELYLRHTTKTMRVLSLVFGGFTVLLFALLLREFGRRLYYQDEWQQQLNEISQSREEMEHIAYATSHDLQEPLRKIQILLDKWLRQQGTHASVDADTAQRVMQSAGRMQELVSDLMILTSLQAAHHKLSCPLQVSVEAAAAQLEDRMKQSQARLNCDILPVAEGYPDQLRMLFRNLLDNALKFAQPTKAPEIFIHSRIASKDELPEAGIQSGRRYYCVSVQDQGIGFDDKAAGKMFGLFRSVHDKQEGNEGAGAGLAICRRIMTNHKGFIVAKGKPNQGATILLFFPIPK